MNRLIALSVALAPAMAFAQSNKVEGGIMRAIPILVGIGMALSTCGLIAAGMKFSSGDPMAKESAKNVFVGSIFILSASAIAGLLKTWFS